MIQPRLPGLLLAAGCFALAGGCAGLQQRLAQQAQQAPEQPVAFSTVGEGWAGNSVNAVVFRKNARVSDATHQ